MPVGSTYSVAVFGDSVMWGQGLRESEKIPTCVIEGLTTRLPRTRVTLAGNFAHSGATIGLRADGSRERGGPPKITRGTRQEVNVSLPSVLDQVEQFQGDAAAIDLVLLNGGINDVNVRAILPSLDDMALKRLTQLHCHDHMKVLLEQTLAKFPNAQVVVCGYYPIITEESNPDAMQPFLIALGLWDIVAALLVGATASGIKQKLAANCALFLKTSDSSLAKAVDEVNRERATISGAARRVHFASPQFERNNAAFAMFPLLFGVDQQTSAPLDPAEVRDARIMACNEAYAGDVFGGQVCHRASAGHPTPHGARRYADEILAVLDGAGVTGVARTFPQYFLWGTATAGYQVEGSITNNDWHVFTTDPAIGTAVHGRGILGGFDIALRPAGDGVGHADRATLVADLDRMVALGMTAYRFSLEWSRIEPRRPQNAHDMNSAALDYYDFVVDQVRARGMQPVVTLNHLTLPEWVLHPTLANSVIPNVDPPFQRSLRGWENSATVDAFVAFVGRMETHFRGHVQTWVTLNEPVASMIGIGYLAGLWSPGLSDSGRARTAYFNLLRAHGRAYDVIKRGNSSARVGIAHAMMYAKPLDPRDVSPLVGDSPGPALRQFDYFFNWHFVDSLTRREVNLTLDWDYRDPTSLRNVVQQSLDNAQADWDKFNADLRASLEDQRAKVLAIKRWLQDSSQRDEIFAAWRKKFGNRAASGLSGPAGATARAAAETAVNLARSGIELILDNFLASIAGRVADIIANAVSLDAAVQAIGDEIFRIIKAGVDVALGGLDLPAQAPIPNEQTLANAAREAIEALGSFRRLLNQAVQVVLGRRSLESLRSGFLDALARTQAAVNTLATSIESSEDFFEAPFRRRLDFLGVNYYRAASVHVGPAFVAVQLAGYDFVGGIFTQNYEHSLDKHHTLLNDLSWEVYPRGLYQLVKTVDREYDHLPVLITENGMPEKLDRNRAAYTVAHLEALHRAHREGVNVLGYLHWSICDNFEWFENYNPKARFGLFTIDRSQTPHPRRITEAALALSLAIQEQGIAGLADRFGTIDPQGCGVSAPLLSPVRSYRGSFGAGPFFQTNDEFALHLTPTTGVRNVLGLLFLRRNASWHRLSVTLNQQGAFNFQLPARIVPDLEERATVTGTITGGTLSGTVSDSRNRSQPLSAQVDPAAGNWIGNVTPRVLQVLRPQLESGLGRVKSLRTSVEQPSWIATLDADQTAPLTSVACAFEDPDHPGVNDFALAANFDSATGQLVGTSNNRRWSALRLPDGLPTL